MPRNEQRVARVFVRGERMTLLSIVIASVARQSRHIATSMDGRATLTMTAARSSNL